MSRYTGPRARISRRLGTNIFGTKGEVIALDKRPYPPGDHGRSRRRGNPSEYLLQLQEKQKARLSYGLSEKQFRSIYAEASRREGVTGENMLKFLELRLDNAVYRAGIAATRPQARQLVNHGHFDVNGKRVDIPSYRLRKGDVVSLRAKAKKMVLVQWNVDVLDRQAPAWLQVADDNHEFTVIDLPSRDQIDIPIREQLIVMQRPKVEELDSSELGDNCLQFSIGPLEPGFGQTLGNSLRRTLLSSIPGSAVTQIRFDDALHEFGTIEGVVEDVTDIVLNLKDLVFQTESDEPIAITVNVVGPQQVTGESFATNSEVDVINPDLHIATVNSKANLSFEVTVEKGVGYLSSDRTIGDGVIGVIPVDALFSPVRRVSFEVGNTRVDQSTDYDELILKIETDGSLTPRDALASAGKTLGSLIGLVESLAEEEVQSLELTEAESPETISPDIDLQIEELELSERPRNCLKRAQIDTVGQLLEKSAEDLMTITNFGQKSLDEIYEKLNARGLSLRVRG